MYTANIKLFKLIYKTYPCKSTCMKVNPVNTLQLMNRLGNHQDIIEFIITKLNFITYPVNN